jgi:4-diphosphocytidyl-2-C-methyl-D-erythritol kinase
MGPPAEETIRVFAPAKINWYLAVERRRSDGYHDIVTVFQTIDWGDELVCRPRRERTCRIACNDPAVPLDETNLVARAWRRLAERCGRRVGGLDVRLVKRIPAGAGLGGGSSDAAAALLALRRMYELPLGREALEAEAAALGSDCAFFIRGGTALGRGRGEALTPLENRLASLALVVVWPGFASPTAAAYSAIEPRHYEPGLVAVESLASALQRGDVNGLESFKRNIFDRVVIPADSRYKTLVERLRAEGLEGAMLAGSGSAVFAIARDPAQARRAARRLANEYPVVRVARLRRCGARLLPGGAVRRAGRPAGRDRNER